MNRDSLSRMPVWVKADTWQRSSANVKVSSVSPLLVARVWVNSRAIMTKAIINANGTELDTLMYVAQIKCGEDTDEQYQLTHDDEEE